MGVRLHHDAIWNGIHATSCRGSSIERQAQIKDRPHAGCSLVAFQHHRFFKRAMYGFHWREFVAARKKYNTKLTKQWRASPGGKFVPGKPKTGGRRKGSLNKLPLQAKEAIIAAFNAYGVNGTGEGGMAGYLYRCCDLVPGVMAAMAAKLMPIQKDEPKQKEEEVYTTTAEFDAALKARGLPTLSHVLALQFDHSDDPRFASLDLTADPKP
jgi:hypothetical protein